jgi:histone-arginine methyltransferase CARM1
VFILIGQVESFLLARDLFLKPDGHILPSAGTLFFCPFTDVGLYNETEAKVSLVLARMI